MKIAQAVGLLFIFTTLRCGSGTPQSTVEFAMRRDQALVIGMGGNVSCKTDSQGRENSPYGSKMFPKLSELATRLPTQFGIEVKTITSCYDETERLAYVHSDRPDDIQRGLKAEFDQFLQTSAGKEGFVMLVGHSYGGWLTMKSSIELARQRLFAATVTIDAISRENCSFSKPLGCLEAPSDIGPSERAIIAESTNQWLNVWQENTWYLHSSEIPEADLNELINTGHSGIQTHERTWSLIEGVFGEFF